MDTTALAPVLGLLFGELVDGAQPRNNFMLNGGDVGLLRSLDQLSAEAASRSVHEGGTVAAHAEHVRYGLSLMNQWARDGGNPFADARWDDAWKMSAVDAAQWDSIRQGLREQAEAWRVVLATPREANRVELAGLVSSIAHLAYHLGAIRQIDRGARGPREGTF